MCLLDTSKVRDVTIDAVEVKQKEIHIYKYNFNCAN